MTTLLALIGIAALLRAFAFTGLRLGMRALEEKTASGLADVSARRGDVTGLTERRGMAVAARRRRRRDLAFTALWLAWLAVPPFTSHAALAYALAAPLWLLRVPRRS